MYQGILQVSYLDDILDHSVTSLIIESGSLRGLAAEAKNADCRGQECLLSYRLPVSVKDTLLFDQSVGLFLEASCYMTYLIS